MTQKYRIKGIIFDMDNTLLHSNIDFPAMKLDVYRHLQAAGVIPANFPVAEHTTSTLLETAKNAGVNQHFYEELLAVAAKHELAGMEGAGLEPGASALLHQLHGRFVLAVVTNNALPAARKALEETGIIHYFDLLVARDHMTSLKPSPSGFLYVIKQFPHIAGSEWLSVGDSWIDGKGSMEAGIPFIGYRTSQTIMEQRGVAPIGTMENIEDLLHYLE